LQKAYLILVQIQTLHCRFTWLMEPVNMRAAGYS